MIYVSFDLETTGGKPDKSAILSIGAVAVDSVHWEIVGEFESNISIPFGRVWEEDTKKWWATQPAALALATTNQVRPSVVCERFLDWIDVLLHDTKKEDRRFAFVANPIAFDLPLLRSYMEEFVGERWKIFSETYKAGLGGLDLPTLAMAVLNRDYADSRRTKWPASWVPDELPHTHVAIDDARLQTHAFIRMMRELNDIHGQGHGRREIR